MKVIKNNFKNIDHNFFDGNQFTEAADWEKI